MRGAPYLHERLSGMLHSKFQVVDPAALELLEEYKVVLHIGERLWVLVEAFFVLDGQTRQLLLPLEVRGDAPLDKFVGDEADEETDGNRAYAYDNCGHPLVPQLRGIFLRDAEGNISDKNDKDLGTAHSDVDTQEEVVARQSLKNVEVVIQTTVAKIGLAFALWLEYRSAILLTSIG